MVGPDLKFVHIENSFLISILPSRRLHLLTLFIIFIQIRSFSDSHLLRLKLCYLAGLYHYLQNILFVYLFFIIL